MVVLVNRAKMTTSTTGTGTITLGSVVDGYQTFAAAGVSNGDSVRYVIEDGTSNWEIGSGTYTASGTTLSRTPSESSGGGSAIDLSGDAIVFISAIASDIQPITYVPTTFTATAGQTAFTVSYTAGLVEVFLNGAKLSTADFTATNGTSIVLASGANVGDTVDVVAYGTVSVSNTYTQAQADALFVDVAGDTMTGNLTVPNLVVSGTVDGVDIAARDAVLTSTTTTANAALPKAGGAVTGNVTFGDNNKAIFGAGSDLQIYHDGTHSYVDDAATGNLRLRGDGLVQILSYSDNETMAYFLKNGAVGLYHNNSEKITTTATGVSVTGNITVTGTVDGRDIATNIPASLGTAGQVLSVNAGANAAEWADVASGGTSNGFVYFMRG